MPVGFRDLLEGKRRPECSDTSKRGRFKAAPRFVPTSRHAADQVRLFNRIRRQAETGLSIAAAPHEPDRRTRSRRGHWETDDLHRLAGVLKRRQSNRGLASFAACLRSTTRMYRRRRRRGGRGGSTGTAAAPAMNESDLLLLKAERLRAEIRYETRQVYLTDCVRPRRCVSALTSGSGGPGWGIHKPRRPRYPLRWRARAGPEARPGKRSPSALLWPPMATPRPYRGGRTLFPGQQPSRRRRCRLKARTTPQRFFNHLRRLTETSR